MEQFPDNSHSAKEAAQVKPQPQKKFDKAITGNATLKKKSEIGKLARIFIQDDVPAMKEHILQDVIISGVRKTIADAASTFLNGIADAVSIMLFGESGRISRIGPGSRQSNLSYQNYYSSNQRNEKRDYTRVKAVGGFDFDDIIFDNYGDAELVLDQLESAIASYQVVSVADLYDLAGCKFDNYVAYKYGWTDLHTAKVVRLSNGYSLQMPRPMQIS